MIVLLIVNLVANKKEVQFWSCCYHDSASTSRCKRQVVQCRATPHCETTPIKLLLRCFSAGTSSVFGPQLFLYLYFLASTSSVYLALYCAGPIVCFWSPSVLSIEKAVLSIPHLYLREGVQKWIFSWLLPLGVSPPPLPPCKCRQNLTFLETQPTTFEPHQHVITFFRKCHYLLLQMSSPTSPQIWHLAFWRRTCMRLRVSSKKCSRAPSSQLSIFWWQ